MLSASEEEQKKLMSAVDLGISKSTGNQGVLDRVLRVENHLEKLAHYNHNNKDNTNSQKHFVYKLTSPTETSTSKNKAEDKNYDEHLTSSTKHQVSEKKAEDTSLKQDAEVTRLLNKENNNLSGSGVAPEKKQEKFMVAPSIYDQKKNTTQPKAGTRGQFLAKKEAMNILGDRKGFAATQLAVKKVSVGDSANSESSTAKDNHDQVKLKNAAELVREQAINDDKQVKEHLRGTFNLDPDIVAKEGGEQLILQKMP
ncbi:MULTISPECIES: hypothetical protein [Cyanophyceae]|uniref:hypothetical protein n=1 Tax=Cyanophyceae TaxID=3028117 RepID=UPI00232B98C3|nr:MULTISPECIES: hypothetical protein [Cyanophyceae]MDB9323960.1 hypothetical protein [Nodularia spumigena CS-591/07A]MDB9332461.1 hypothetical protein [Nodularia spumigena CS-591/04]MDB9341342.1 hypothetical protein [Nodularia spumigena CS-589/07]MDB9361301.1 hypothetical protein [Nodularia spumigena CS-588/02]MDB9364872.1 hypothetical protein [Nodularia spumigena CS-588/02A10]